MRPWAETASGVAATSRTSEKVALLAGYLGPLDPLSLTVACVFFTGRPFPAADPRSAGVGWAAVREAVERVAGAAPGAFGEAYDRSSDPGRAAYDLLATRDAERERLGERVTHPDASLPEVQAAFAAIVEARRPAARVDLLAGLLERLDPLPAMYVVKVLSGELRIGLREGLVESAVASAFGRPVAEVRHALMATGDIGEVARLAREDRLSEARPSLFRPLQPMLASPARDAEVIAGRMASPMWAEDKYDGIRAQLHKRGREVRLYSRDLHDITRQFPDVAGAARPMPWDGILDGELLAMDGGSILPFARLQNRLGRVAPSPATLAEVPAGYVTFDAIALSPAPGEPVAPLLDVPLAERRARLESLERPARIVLGHLEHPDSPGALDEAFDASRARGNEGLVVKDPASGYTPGRRGLAWLKLKKALATLDCVVVGVEVGHGKRHGVLSDYTFAVRDDRPGHEGALVTVGKAYSGLTDAEIAEMTHWFEAHTLKRLGRYRLVEPVVVVEVAFDRIQASTRHGSGYAMRFPRIARLRLDKGPDEADTLSAVAALTA
ncbi:MAG: ATP-dependent DNA ligase [Chloroflexi bacterium]|nr:ATP-dependent DNA ligase [Chloroflexota bacterium]